MGAPSHDRKRMAYMHIFGNIFRPIVLPSPITDASVLELARSIDDTREFARLPLLADALERIRVTNLELLEHCRSDSPHVTDCWALDVVLNRC
jgi:hypothetical protein